MIKNLNTALLIELLTKSGIFVAKVWLCFYNSSLFAAKATHVHIGLHASGSQSLRRHGKRSYRSSFQASSFSGRLQLIIVVCYATNFTRSKFSALAVDKLLERYHLSRSRVMAARHSIERILCANATMIKR